MRIGFVGFPDFSESCWNLYVHLQQRSEFEFVWFVNHPSSVPVEAKRADTRVVSRRSVAGVALSRSVDVIVHSHGLPRNFLPKRSCQIVNVWHGMPLKKIAALDDPTYQTRREELCIATSPLFASIIGKCFNVKSDLVAVTGLPRNDPILSTKVPNLPTGSSQILWMPTYRSTSTGVTRVDSNSFGSLELCETARLLDRNLDRDQSVVLRLHPMDEAAAVLKKETFSRLRVSTAADPESVNDLYRWSTALVTDYSSAMFDYLLLDRPVIRFVPDLRCYTRGFIEEVVSGIGLPGVEVEHPQLLLELLNAGSLPKVQTEVLRNIHTFFDGESSNRVSDLLLN